MAAMQELSQIVFVVEDDASMRGAIKRLVSTAGLSVGTFESAEGFLGSPLPDVPSCVIVDVRLPGLSGLDLQAKMADRGISLPIIFITGHGDVTMSVQAMKAGAIEFLTKPFREQDLLDAIGRGIHADRTARGRRTQRLKITRHYDSLTAREREVMRWVVGGLLNKQIAAKLGIGEKTVKVHRHQVMTKMHAESLADLVRMAASLGINSHQ
jgi:FixJ family two-component response regulator